MKKQLLTTLVMLMALVIHAEWSDWRLAKEEYDINGRTWKISVSGDSVAIRDFSPSSGDVVIPSSVPVEYYREISSSEKEYKTVTLPVKALSQLSNKSQMVSLTIPDSVTTAIYNTMFYECSSLTTVNVGNGVTRFDDFAFVGCSSLKSLNIGNGVTSIGGSAFSRCSSLTSLTIPSNVKSIGGYAFNGCSSLTSLTIPDSVTSIGEGMFCGCSSLTSVSIPDVLTSIGADMFNGCRSLASFTISERVTSIGASAFKNCSLLTSITIPSGVTSIGDNAFYGCSGLTSITIPDSVTSIGASAFYGCSNIGCIDVGAGVTSIGEKCFCSCMNLTNVIFRGNAPTTVGGLVFSETSLDLNVVVQKNSTGWTGASGNLPARWPYNTETGRYIRYAGDEPISSERIVEVHLSVTNIVVNYVFNSVQPEFAVPMSTTDGFVNIIAQVHGGASGIVAVPDSWPGNYSAYHQKFGSDFTQSLTKKTGKKDGAGNDMFVWQDFVAGTDPTDENDVFTASITLDSAVG